MKITGHAPLPWNQPLTAAYSDMFNTFYCLIRDDKGNIQQKIYGRTAEEAEANAELIVNAVNHYKVLLDIAGDYDETLDNFKERLSPKATEAHQKLKSLIEELKH